MPGLTLMFQGTASHVGKSVMVTAFCRLLSRQGVRVAPFKAMNMSNNAWVTKDGKEMAHAQAVQAWAAGIEPSVMMNPVLLKTMSDSHCQIVISGKPVGVVQARDLAGWRDTISQAVTHSLEEMMSLYDVVVIEGAGSPAEVNLQTTDFSNMAVARQVKAPVVLVADIERGGVFAQIVGTLELLSAEDRDLIQGFIINKFRGDISLLDGGVRWLEERTGRKVLGVVPHVGDLGLPEEDSLGIPNPGISYVWDTEKIRIEVIQYPTISNFTDFDPLRAESEAAVEFIARPPANGHRPDLLILPGAKSTTADLAWLRERGFDRYIADCVHQGVEVLGICGGFQMLGKMIYDPSHVESQVSVVQGLGLLPTDTLFLPTKVTAQVKGRHIESGSPITGYEIHHGRLQGGARGRALFRISERGTSAVDESDGCATADGMVWGTYLHGIFEEGDFRRHLLGRLRERRGLRGPGAASPSDRYDRLADLVKGSLRSWDEAASAWGLPCL